MWTIVVLRGKALHPTVHELPDKKSAVMQAKFMSALHGRATYDVNFECQLVVVNADGWYSKDKV